LRTDFKATKKKNLTQAGKNLEIPKNWFFLLRVYSQNSLEKPKGRARAKGKSEGEEMTEKLRGEQFLAEVSDRSKEVISLKKLLPPGYCPDKKSS